MIGEDITQVLPVEADTEGEITLTEDIRQTERMTPEQREQLFYSCLRGYGWKG